MRFFLNFSNSTTAAPTTFCTGCKISRNNLKDKLKKMEIYENDICKVVFTPALSSQYEHTKELFLMNRHPDMCLLVVELCFLSCVEADRTSEKENRQNSLQFCFHCAINTQTCSDPAPCSRFSVNSTDWLKAKI